MSRGKPKRRKAIKAAMDARWAGKPLPCTCWERPIPSGVVYHECAACTVARIMGDERPRPTVGEEGL
jgi:hypothetical protein